MATLREYFETDFTHVVRVRVTFSVGESQVEAYWLVDFLGHMSYLSCYIPESGKEVDYFISLIKSLKYGATNLNFVGKITLPSARQFPGELRVENESRLGLHARFFGDSTSISAIDLPMSRRVYIYSESNLSESDIVKLKSAGSEVGHEVQFRSINHAKSRSNQESPAAFISYDHRDRDVAQKIAIGLRRMMSSVWYDEYSLAAGVNLRESIEKGIRECKRCIVVLSKNFFSNNGWTKKEFDSIFIRETLEGRSLVIPVWLDVDKKDVFTYCPSLLNVRGLSWQQQGEEDVCRKISRAIEDDEFKEMNRKLVG